MSDLLRGLAALSARLGNDLTLVQGAGGNTSCKIGNTLWVKASGKLLADAERDDMFVGVDLAAVRERISQGRGDDLSGTVADGPQGLRPSIETTLHALLPHEVVLHVHSIRTIALAVRCDAQDILAARLGGLRWKLAPYRRPGLPLTEAVAQVLAGGAVDVLVLGNHGLVVGGRDCAAAEALLAEVEARLAPDYTRSRFEPDIAALETLTQDSIYGLPHEEEGHILASEGGATLAAAGSLYPDHVVFLGPAVAVLRADHLLPVAKAADIPAPAVVVIPGKGIVVRRDLTKGAEEMVRALGMVVALIPDGAALSYLSQSDERELLGWDAEKYRQSLSA